MDRIFGLQSDHLFIVLAVAIASTVVAALAAGIILLVVVVKRASAPVPEPSLDVEGKAAPLLSRDEKQARTWAALCHLSALSAFVGVPFGTLLGPLVVWLAKRNDSPFIDEQGREAVNFQLSMLIYGIIAGLLVLLIVGIVLLIALMVADVILVIIASIRASNGERFRYPATLRLIS